MYIDTEDNTYIPEVQRFQHVKTIMILLKMQYDINFKLSVSSNNS